MSFTTSSRKLNWKKGYPNLKFRKMCMTFRTAFWIGDNERLPFNTWILATISKLGAWSIHAPHMQYISASLLLSRCQSVGYLAWLELSSRARALEFFSRWGRTLTTRRFYPIVEKPSAVCANIFATLDPFSKGLYVLELSVFSLLCGLSGYLERRSFTVRL